MARIARQHRENELPYIPFGPFHIRFPFVHYKLESVEFIQSLILGVTALAAVPYLELYLGIPYELAWSCIIIETMLYMLHSLLGDPVVPGWITPTLPLTIVFLEGFPMGPQRIQAMIALQMLGGMASFRIATFLSVLLIPVVSFFRPIFGVASSIRSWVIPLDPCGESTLAFSTMISPVPPLARSS